MKTTNDTAPAVYVGTYAKYNNGSLAGAWIKLDGHDADTFADACRVLHHDEQDPELMFQDFEGFPEGFYSESWLAPELWDWIALDDDDRLLWAAYVDATGDTKASIDDARDAFAGRHDTGADFAEETATLCGEIPDTLPAWIVIDWAASWECNLRHDYSTAEIDGEVWFFRNC